MDPGAGVAGLHRVEGALVQAMVTASLYTHFLLQCPRIFYFSEGGDTSIKQTFNEEKK